MSLRAQCPDCSKTFRVPHADKAWNCKECGGTLTLEEPEPAPPEESECPSCGALYFAAESFCAECGTSLAAGADTRGPDQKKKAAAELRRAFRRVARLKSWVTYNLVVAIFYSIIIALFVAFGDASVGDRVFMSLVQGAILALAILSRVYIEKRPFPILVTLASVSTLSNLLYFLHLFELGSAPIIRLGGPVVTIILWFLTAEAAQVARIARQYPDLYLAKRMRGEHLTHRGESRRESAGQRRVRKQREHERRKFWTRIAVAGGVLIAIGIGSAAYRVIAAPPSPETALEEFRVAWNNVDREAIVAGAIEAKRPRLRRSLEIARENWDWDTQMPRLEEPEWKLSSSDVAVAKFPAELGYLRVEFKYVEDAWRLNQIGLKQGIKNWRPRD